jgi:uncharacterized protein YjbJ (UPF0337 family)
MPDEDRVKGSAGHPEGAAEEGVGSLKGDAEKRGGAATSGSETPDRSGAADIPKTG